MKISDYTGVWQEEQVVKSFQIGPNYILKPTAIAEFFQEAAGNHSNAEKFGMREMMALGKAWVLGSIKYKINQWPKWSDNLLIETWVFDVQKFSSQRNFIMKNQKEEVLIEGSSNWFGIDFKKRKPTYIDDFMDVVHVREDLTTTGKPDKLRGLERVDHSSQRKAVFSDLDPVNHVNNIKYLEWMIDSLPAEVKKKSLSQVETNYLSEVRLDEEVKILSEIDQVENGFNIITCIMKEEKPACILHTVWE
ncbi:acyl-[acyl-carrier-protein] thioesterase [Flammeovirga agarivorans]|uniref:Acyl-ACP thioesterase n=1 Tax=Flammeovirga agarivorans TaxID=2726742 RepID=A0A7X8SPB9_9BACT|nr:acyl-ACP thioesterase domain-containing protein [Flammeovirga agarivorans]NLR93911.1 hypothetical protein [Flammeovirga agarivorans]